MSENHTNSRKPGIDTSGIAEMIQGLKAHVSDPHEYETKVKGLVSEQLHVLDTKVNIEKTPYFGHSAVPDFILTWPDQSSRDLFLRPSLESIYFLDGLKGENPRARVGNSLLVSLTDGHEHDQFGPSEVADSQETIDTEDQLQVDSDILVSDIRVLEELGEAASQEDSIRSFPLQGYIRSKFLKSGRGVLAGRRAKPVLDLVKNSNRLSLEAPEAILRIEQSFILEESRNLKAMAKIVELALSAGDERSIEDLPFSPSLIPALLPWLLTDNAVRTDEEFWSALGSKVNLADVLKYGEELSALDLSPLVERSFDKWTGLRSSLTFGISLDSGSKNEETKLGDVIATPGIPGWSVEGHRISKTALGLKMEIASEKRAMYSKKAGFSAELWENTDARLQDWEIRSGSLRGLSRSITVEAEEVGDVRDDLRNITDTVTDRYYVDEIGVSLPNPDEEGEIVPTEIDFGSRQITAKSAVWLTDLARLTLHSFADTEYVISDDGDDPLRAAFPEVFGE